MKLNEQRKPRQIQTRSGTVEGKQIRCNKGPVDVFLGIPYAKPPIGERRFRVDKILNPYFLTNWVQLVILNYNIKNDLKNTFSRKIQLKLITI